jgi:RNA polymerase sigma-70 factor (ECF subfamily)
MAGTDITSNLIAAARSGNEYAFARLVRLYQSPVRAFARRLSAGDAALADDLSQETFIKAHRDIRNYAATGKFVSWLYGILYRQFLDYIRKQSRRDKVMIEQYVHEDMDLDTELVLDLKHDLETAMQFLKYNERVAITLCFSEGLTHQEASEIMSIPVGTVKSHISRGREKLKKHLSIWNEKRASR